METAIYNIAGEDTGKKIELNESIFGIEPNDHAIYLDVKQYMANNRQGTHKSKERAEIIGSTRKIKRQKGTGTARAGSIKSPLFRGGGRAFGPRPRNYYFKLNKKVKQLARKSALSYKAKNEGLIILENFSFEKPSTKEFVNFETNLKINDKKCLLVLSEQNKNIYLSSRNLKGSKVVMISELTTYDILDASVLLVVDSAIDVLESFFKK
ncbi:MAG: 50S ribosomal protein L4 [Bacteroidetes bacterium]|jgi:large subunit ribosomal protein L4|nr:50S ribosomal protein L4 [Bacteroidota bacterium]MBT6684837.1 50S ribosomal protein L4 [Bacteroidota bacterium]MBT7142531.1 50S ribosomal protein L4 [Bacteroidota bacterium]MBT7493228.1 50S ribosomal protein L4 [Bacteroidota bacterium]